MNERDVSQLSFTSNVGLDFQGFKKNMTNLMVY